MSCGNVLFFTYGFLFSSSFIYLIFTFIPSHQHISFPFWSTSIIFHFRRAHMINMNNEYSAQQHFPIQSIHKQIENHNYMRPHISNEMCSSLQWKIAVSVPLMFYEPSVLVDCYCCGIELNTPSNKCKKNNNNKIDRKVKKHLFCLIKLQLAYKLNCIILIRFTCL